LEVELILNLMISIICGFGITLTLVRDSRLSINNSSYDHKFYYIKRILFILILSTLCLLLFTSFSNVIFIHAVYVSIGLIIAIKGLLIMGFIKNRKKQSELYPDTNLKINGLSGILSTIAFFLASISLATLSHASTIQFAGLVGILILTSILLTVIIVWLNKHFLNANEYILRIFRLAEIESGLFLVLAGMLIMSGKIYNLTLVIDRVFMGS